MDKQKTDDFLWYSYFGITRREAINDKEEALSACVRRAYLDLCRTLRFVYSTNKIDKGIRSKDSDEARFYQSYQTCKNNLIDCINKRLAHGILELLEKSYDFSEWHETICGFIMNVDPSREVFEDGIKYGQAQKWVNMTFKYMLVMGLWDDKITEKMQYLHVPLDSIVFNAANSDEDYGLGIPTRSLVWSKMDKQEYIEYQKLLKSKIKNKFGEKRPIEWEFDAWLKQAQIEKEKGRNNIND